MTAVPLVDTHAHLTFPALKGDLSAVLERASAAGVSRIITIGTTAETSARARILAEAQPSVFFAAGVHPSDTLDAAESDLAAIEALLAHPKAVAVGETGTDHFHEPHRSDPAARAIQDRWFERHLDLAARLALPVVIHQRASWARTLEILTPWTGRIRAVFHCFSESYERAKTVLGMGHLVSFTGIVSFKNAPELHDCVRKIPDDAWMLETDSPYLSPVPHRGKRCEPAFVRDTAAAVAALRGTNPESIAALSTANAEHFFTRLRSVPPGQTVPSHKP